MAQDGSAAGRRLVGVDVARALAIIGMVAVHFAPRPQRDDSTAAWLLQVPFGKASILFALVAGVGVSILAARRPDTVRARLGYRGIWLLPAGLGLSLLDHPVAVILQYYAVWFVLAAFFVRVRGRTLLVVSAVWLVLGSLAVAWVSVTHPDWLLLRGGESPGGEPAKLLLTGFYPTATWMPVVLVGMWAGRLDLAAAAVRRNLVLGGAFVATSVFVVGHALGDPPPTDTWELLRSVEGHSEMPLAIVGTVALDLAVLGACLWAAERTRLLRPVAAMGEGALSVYVGHLIVWHVTGDLFRSTSTQEAWVTVGWFTLVSCVALWAWLAVFRRGPLETVVRWPFERGVVPLIDLAAGRLVVGAAPRQESSGDEPGMPPGT